MELNELYHHGVKGQRWGVRRTLAQLGYKVTGRKLKKKKTGGFFSSKKKQREKEKAEEEKVDIETQKSKILASRSAKQLYDNANLFTTEELYTAYNRLTLEKNLKNLAPAEVSKGQRFVDKMNKISNVGQSVSKVAGTGIDIYNNAAKIYNAFSPNGRKKPLPIIGNKDKSKDKNGDDADDNNTTNNPFSTKSDKDKSKSSESKTQGKSERDIEKDVDDRIRNAERNAEKQRQKTQDDIRNAERDFERESERSRKAQERANKKANEEAERWNRKADEKRNEPKFVDVDMWENVNDFVDKSNTSSGSSYANNYKALPLNQLFLPGPKH